MAYKVYKLIKDLYLTTSFTVGGKQQWVDFDGGTLHGQFTPGRFGTSDEDLQQAIEKDKAYNVKFVIDKPLTEIANNNVQTDTTGGNEGNVGGNLEDFITVDNVANAQQAKAYLLATYPQLTPDMVSNIEKMKEVMASVDEKPIKFNGYNPR